MKLWICTLLVAVLVLFSAKEIPAYYEGIKNARLLREHGRTITGHVTAHNTLPSGKGCRTQTDIGYAVQGSVYTVRIAGCASARDLPIGREVDVRYLPYSPSIAAVTVPGASTPQYDWTSFLFLSGSLVLLLMGVGREWMKRTNARNKKRKRRRLGCNPSRL